EVGRIDETRGIDAKCSNGGTEQGREALVGRVGLERSIGADAEQAETGRKLTGEQRPRLFVSRGIRRFDQCGHDRGATLPCGPPCPGGWTPAAASRPDRLVRET